VVVHTTDELPVEAVDVDAPEAVPELLAVPQAAAPRQSAPASTEAETPFVNLTDSVFIRTPKS
jgi:hypothetical protein